HLIVLGALPREWTGLNRSHEDGKIEIYSRGRFFTMTGLHIEGTPVSPLNRREYVLELYLKIAGAAVKDNVRGLDHQLAGARSSASDDGLVETALRKDAKLTRLWKGDISEYDQDESRADLALCCKLAFWTGKDPERMDRLFRLSGLMR